LSNSYYTRAYYYLYLRPSLGFPPGIASNISLRLEVVGSSPYKPAVKL
jgi:hypothetical protein